MDLAQMTLVEIKELQQRIPAELKRREEGEKQSVLNEMRTLAVQRGFTLEEVLGKPKKGTRSGTPVKIKYRHPSNPDLQWTGRGRKPVWVQEWLNQGGSLESLLV